MLFRILLEDFVDGDEAVGGFDGVNVGIGFVGIEFARAACHFENEHSGGDIPEGNTGFDIGVESSAGGVGHGKGGAAHHAHFAAAEGGFAKAFESDFERFFIFAATDEDDGLFEFGALADAERLAIEEDFAASFGGPELVGHGVVDDAGQDVFAFADGDGDAEVGDAVEEVDGAVDGVDDPLEFGVLIAAESFFAVEGVVWELFGDALEDEVLALAVELQLEVVVEGFVDGFVLMKIVAEELSCFLCGGDGGFEIRHGRRFSRGGVLWEGRAESFS